MRTTSVSSVGRIGCGVGAKSNSSRSVWKQPNDCETPRPTIQSFTAKTRRAAADGEVTYSVAIGRNIIGA